MTGLIVVASILAGVLLLHFVVGRNAVGGVLSDAPVLPRVYRKGQTVFVEVDGVGIEVACKSAALSKTLYDVMKKLPLAEGETSKQYIARAATIARGRL